MQRKEALSFIFKVFLLGLAILLIIFGLYPKLLNGENQEMHYESPEGKSMPDGGYETEMINGFSYVKVVVEADADVEVHMYVSTYRGGNVIKNTANESVTQDTYLAAGDDDERIGRNIELSDFSAYPASYRVRVVEPDTSVPSEVNYKITIKAYSVDMTLIIAGLLFYAIFIFLGIFEYLSSINRMLKSGVAMAPAAASEVSDLEALLEPAAAAPPAMAAEPAPPTAPPAYDAMMAQQPMPAPPPPALEAMAPAPAVPEAAPAYAPPPPPSMPPQPVARPPAPVYQPPPPAAPAPAPAPVAPAPAPMAPAPAPAMAPEPVSKVRCPACKSIVPVYTNERPTPIECPTCGKKGMIR